MLWPWKLSCVATAWYRPSFNNLAGLLRLFSLLHQQYPGVQVQVAGQLAKVKYIFVAELQKKQIFALRHPSLAEGCTSSDSYSAGKNCVFMTTMNLFAKQCFFSSFKHPTTFIKAEEITEFGERFSELGFRTDVDLCSFTLQRRLGPLWAFKDTSCLFSESVFSPSKKTFPYLPSVKLHFSASSYVSETRPRHAGSRAHLWETNQPFPNYMPLFGQIKPVINATLLEGKTAVTYFGYNTPFTCFDSVQTCVTIRRVGDILCILKKKSHGWRIWH